jgi:rod shape-determining protein MreC
MALSRRSGRSRFTLILLVLTSITILTLDFRGSSAVRGVRDAAATAFSPVRGAAEKVFSPVGNVWNGIWHYGDVKKENDQLRNEVDDLRGQAALNADAAKQLEDLKQLSALDSLTQYQQVTARVASGAIGNFENTIQLDKGSGAGLKVGMPVLTGAGLVGRIVQVTSDTSVVKLITDADSQIGVRFTTSGAIAVATGTGIGNPLKVDSGVPVGTNIPADDIVSTSSLARSIFPPDMLIGRVTKVEPAGDQINSAVTIEPAADLTRLSYVRILLWEPQP